MNSVDEGDESVGSVSLNLFWILQKLGMLSYGSTKNFFKRKQFIEIIQYHKLNKLINHYSFLSDVVTQYRVYREFWVYYCFCHLKGLHIL